jgi:hypothetical protein
VETGFPIRLRSDEEFFEDFETGNPMCLLCDDEKAYQAYMDYLDAKERQGKSVDGAADRDKAIGAVLDKLQAAAGNAANDAPENDKTLSPFFCSPVNK